MSFFKPDFDYKPSESLFTNHESKKYQPLEKIFSGSDLTPFVSIFAKQLDDEDLYRFYTNICLSFKTSVNVSDSESFLVKFLEAFLFTIQKTFPDMEPSDFDELKEKIYQLNKTLAKILKSGNVENKYLLPLALGLIEAMLSYKSY
jgi:hypothetical protein